MDATETASGSTRHAAPPLVHATPERGLVHGNAKLDAEPRRLDLQLEELVSMTPPRADRYPTLAFRQRRFDTLPFATVDGIKNHNLMD